MDIKKEREAFEAYFKDKYPELHKDVFDENGDDRAIIGYSFALSAWQAAKAQAVPEGFLLMPRKCTNKMAHAAKAVDGRLSAFKYADVYDAMIEAQEQSHDNSN